MRPLSRGEKTMAKKFDWERARTKPQLWAYRAAPGRPQYSRNDWRAAKLKRQIADLTADIGSKTSWLQTIASTDPQRSRLAAKIAALKLRRWNAQRTLDGIARIKTGSL